MRRARLGEYCYLGLSTAVIQGVSGGKHQIYDESAAETETYVSAKHIARPRSS